MRIAVIGSGVAGLVAAYKLGQNHNIVLFEREPRPGGHTNTVDVTVDGEVYPVDTGFIVHNSATYPGFIKLLEELKIPVRETTMSFSVVDEKSGIEWRGSSVATLLAKRSNLMHPEFFWMLLDIVRFNREANRALSSPVNKDMTLREFCLENRYSKAFARLYLVPLTAAIWSADPAFVLDAPASHILAFLDNHGLLQLRTPRTWRTIQGGARTYVNALLERFRGVVKLGECVNAVHRHASGVDVVTEKGVFPFDQVVIACHSDEALALLDSPSDKEQEVLGTMHYLENHAVLHTDASLLPTIQKVRASWNVRTGQDGNCSFTYSSNRLQGFRTSSEICVTLNAEDRIAPKHVIKKFTYSHPIIDRASVKAQSRWHEINGVLRTWFCGAYWGYGFHEDGFQSACRVVKALGGQG